MTDLLHDLTKTISVDVCELWMKER